MSEEETVLCIRRKDLPESWVEKKSMVPLSLDLFCRQCSKAGFSFMARSVIEKDPAYKQIIPYIVIQTLKKEKTAAYSRKGSEKRLHDLWSVGIGGHINPADIPTQDPSFQDLLLAGMKRELSEELMERPERDIPSFVGLISEDITDVGKVHLGAVFRILTLSPERYRPGSELSDFGWHDTHSLLELNMELWSTLALQLLSSV